MIETNKGAPVTDIVMFSQEVSRKAVQCAQEIRRTVMQKMGNKIQLVFGIHYGDF